MLQNGTDGIVSGAANATLTCYFSQIRLNVISPPTLRTFVCFLAFMYSNEKFVSFLTSLMDGIYDSPTLSSLLLFIFDYVASNERIIHGRWIWKDLQGRWLRFCPGICLQAMSKIAKHPNQDSQFPSWVSNRDLPNRSPIPACSVPSSFIRAPVTFTRNADYGVPQVTVLYS
jgi:hypothetical protein